MGLGDEHFVEPAAISQRLLCPICMDVFDDPQALSDCFHTFCLSCISESVGNKEECPECRTSATIGDLRPNLIVRALIDELVVMCPSGCAWRGRLGARTGHLAICPVTRLKKERDQALRQRKAAVSQRSAAEQERKRTLARVRELEAELGRLSRHLDDQCPLQPFCRRKLERRRRRRRKKKIHRRLQVFIEEEGEDEDEDEVDNERFGKAKLGRFVLALVGLGGNCPLRLLCRSSLEICRRNLERSRRIRLQLFTDEDDDEVDD